jgi:hypothetical protein
MLTAAVLTCAAILLKSPPVWMMRADRRWVISLDSMRTTREGFQFDGSKAERELGIVYTPIRAAIEEAIRSYAAS